MHGRLGQNPVAARAPAGRPTARDQQHGRGRPQCPLISQSGHPTLAWPATDPIATRASGRRRTVAPRVPVPRGLQHRQQRFEAQLGDLLRIATACGESHKLAKSLTTWIDGLILRIREIIAAFGPRGKIGRSELQCQPASGDPNSRVGRLVSLLRGDEFDRLSTAGRAQAYA